jgi:hypothetical protein
MSNPKNGDSDDATENGAANGYGGDEELTPEERPPRRPASDAALRLARAATLLNSIATEFASAGGLVDRLAPNERPLFVRRIVDAGRVSVEGLSAFLDDIEADSIG